MKILISKNDDEGRGLETQGVEKIKKVKHYNQTAIIGFALSIVSIFGIGLLGLIGLILDVVALTQIKYTKEGGKGFAWSAIAIGFTWSFAIGILRRLVETGF